MASSKRNLRSSKPQNHDRPTVSRETPSADDSDEDNDEKDIPNKVLRPTSSISNAVSLGRPTSNQAGQAGRSTRSGRNSLPLQTREPVEQPSKRRKTVHGHDAYAIPSSPPGQQDSADAQAQDNAAPLSPIEPGTMDNIHGFLGGSTSASVPADAPVESIPAIAPESDRPAESEAATDRQQAEPADEQLNEVAEEEDEGLFVESSDHEDKHNNINAQDDVQDAKFEEEEDGEENEAEVTDDRSDIMDGVEYDGLEDYEDRGPPSAERFKEDLINFNQRHEEDDTFPVSFTAPTEDDSESARVQFEQFRLAVLCMKGETWTGYLRATWVNQPMHTYFDPITTPGKALFSLVRKFESLCAAMPEAPRLSRQTRFLKEHQSIISHYLSQLVSILQHISHVRLAASKANSGQDSMAIIEEKETILNEAFRIHIPLLLHCSHIIWKLAGRDDKNCFTAGTMDLLEFFLQAARLECESIIRLLRPTSEEKKAASSLKPIRAERHKQVKRVMELIIYAINNVKSSRETLEEMGEKRIIRQREQERLREQLERDRQATQTQLNEIESRRASMPSTQATGSSSSQSRRPPSSAPLKPMPKRPREQPPSATQRPAQREQAQPLRPIQLSKPSREPVRSRPRRPAEVHYRPWSLEEQRFLLREIKKAYIAIDDKPQLPDIDGYLRKELNRPINDILNQTDGLLRLMLTKLGVVTDKIELEGWVQKLMHTYDGVGRLPSRM